MQVALLGRQPRLSLAELEALYGSQALRPLGDGACLVDHPRPLPQSRLGGSLKTGRVLERLPVSRNTEAFAYLATYLPSYVQQLPEGKLQLGISSYGLNLPPAQLRQQSLELKKAIKATGRSLRVVENKAAALSSAQVLYNKLTGPLGCEILLIQDGTEVVVAQTTGVQNIDNYAHRDFGRPGRDSFVGMLPPKLAQLMINLAFDRSAPKSDQPLKLLDPFCGSGVILQEALLMGYQVSGTDLSPRMIDYTQKNLTWLKQTSDYSGVVGVIAAADATHHTWPSAGQLNAVVSEVYLGKPLTALPSPSQLEQIITQTNQLTTQFLQNLAPQLTTTTRLCLALPAWHLGVGQFRQLPLLDQLAKLGYNRIDFAMARPEQLIYHRSDQTVARALTVLQKRSGPTSN